jgi:uncharacterized membrane protein YphA (DoxX/SURF4 family)
VQKLFSAFPDGWPGIGLVLLRLAVASSAIDRGVWVLVASDSSTFALRILAVTAILAGLALLIGFITPVISALTTIGYLVMSGSLLLQGGTVLRYDAITALDLAVVSIALVLLGPGAFSLDARLFGKREIIIPEGRRSPR